MSPTCAICLESMRIWNQIANLECGHRYHRLCADKLKTRRCPICYAYIATEVECMLLKSADDYKSIGIVARFRDQIDVYEMLKRNDLKPALERILLSYGNVTDALKRSLKDRDYDTFLKLAECPTINWHVTIDGRTILELLASTNIRVHDIVKYRYFTQKKNDHSSFLYPNLSKLIPSAPSYDNDGNNIEEDAV